MSYLGTSSSLSLGVALSTALVAPTPSNTCTQRHKVSTGCYCFLNDNTFIQSETFSIRRMSKMTFNHSNQHCSPVFV